MADFKTHITVSTALGVGYGAAGCYYADMPIGVSVLAGGLCSVSGMLPDLDSDSGVPLRESLAFAAAVMPMLMIPRWRTLGFTPEMMVLAGALVYLIVRFGVGWALRKYTVHRGMFHSLPAALIATEVAFLVYSRKDINLRYFVAGGVAVGFMSHLILDEIWSIGVKRGQIALKKSFGTAIKLWSGSLWGNFSCYGKLIALSYLVLHDPAWMYDGITPSDNIRMIAQKVLDRVRGTSEEDEPPLREISQDELDKPREIRILASPPNEDQYRDREAEPYWDAQPEPDRRYEGPPPRFEGYRYRRYDDAPPSYQR